MSTQIKELIAASVLVKQNILSDEKILGTVQDCINVITAAFNSGNKVLFCGNGGSAADAQHLAATF